MYFSRIFRATPLQMKVSATAGIANPATFSVGSRLVALRGGVINGAVSALLGTDVNLSVMDYQALIDARVRIDGALNAISTEANLQAVKLYGRFGFTLRHRFDAMALDTRYKRR